MVIMVLDGGVFGNTVVKFRNSIITNFQVPAFVPQGGASRRQANNQIITKISMTNNQTCFLNHIDDWLTIGYWVIGDYLVPPWRDWNLVIGYSFYD